MSSRVTIAAPETAGGVPMPDLADARAALGDVVPRLIALIRQAPDPSVHAIGEWSVADVAAHMAHAWETLPRLLRGEMAAPLSILGELSGMTTALVDVEPDRDLASLANRVEAAAGRFLAEPADTDIAGSSAWLVEGVQLPRAVVMCHLLSEALVHGDDIARASAARWRIAPAHAALAITGFVLPVLTNVEPDALVDHQRALGFRAVYAVDLRGHGSAVLAFDNGRLTVNPTPPPPVDCHISADPAAFLLVMWGRRGQWPAIATGKLLAWGRRPWLAPRLRAVMRNP